MIAGTCIGTFVEFKLKMPFAPTSENVFSDKMIFENDELAREFIVLHPQENE